MKLLRIPNIYDAKAVSEANRIVNEEDSLTIQSGKDDADINVIVKRMGVGVMPIGNMRIPMVGDFSHITDFRSVIELADNARAAFLQLPADLRQEFGNDPVRFMAEVDNPEFMQELEKRGAVLDNGKDSAIVTPKPEDSPKA